MTERVAPARVSRAVYLLLLSISVVASWQSAANAIEISDPKWGFNGKVAPHRFNLLTVLVTNPTPVQFTGEIRLRKTLGGAGAVDVPIVETVTLSPSSQKLVQFYPFISSDMNYNGTINEQWHVSYPGGSVELPTPRVAKYQRIILDDPNSVMSRGGAVKFHFSDAMFPPFVTATDSLQVVVLDHVPRWEESRRQAFLDWLSLGGTLILLQDTSGKFPDFTGPMAVLKTPLEDQSHGLGRIIKVSRTRAEFQENDYRQICAGLPKNYYPSNVAEKTDDIIDRADTEEEEVRQSQSYGYSDMTDPYKSSYFLGQLKNMTKPEHNWLLLHILFWNYIALIFPGCYLLGRYWTDFRVVYAGLLGTVILFSILFSYVGQRGYGEATAIHSVAIARSLPDNQMDVSTWSNVFVVNGANYDIRLNGTGTLFSTCNDHEAVKGFVNNGAEALFRVDIPPFSNREYATRAKIPFQGPRLTIDSVKLDSGRLSELVLDVQGLVPNEVQKKYALVGTTFYNLEWKDGKLVLGSDAGNVVSMLRVQEKRNTRHGYDYGFETNKVSVADRYSQMFDSLLARALNVSREKDAETFRVPSGQIDVLLYTTIPPEFAVQNQFLTHQEGRVLYSIGLSPTEGGQR